MTLPPALQSSLDQSLAGISTILLQKHFASMSQIYRKGGASESIFSSDAGCLAYFVARMPATFGAVDAVLKEMKARIPDWEGKTLLDLGAGPGTASWAALDHFPSIVKPVLIDQSLLAIRWGKRLAKEHPILSKGEWVQSSLVDETPFPKTDLAIICYALIEIARPAAVIEKIWKNETPLLIAIEPGTPQGFERLRKVREQWLQLGGYLVAPCPHALTCPMQKGDWCHFSVRLSRTKLHRLLKTGDLGHEDEKFSYLILSRTPRNQASKRVLRHPIKNKGHVQMVLCAQSGKIENRTVARRDRELYKIARDAEWGDT